MALLEVNNLNVYYGVIHALKDVSFHVDKGEIVALIGANGAGKTTTLHTLSGLLHPQSGSILYKGEEITKVPGHKIVSMGMAQVPEGRRVFADLTVEQNLRLGALRGKTRQRPARRWIKSTRNFRDLRRGRSRYPERSPAASSRCWLWAAH